MKTLGHVAKANRVGRKISEALPLTSAILVRFPEFGDAEFRKLEADGPSRVAQLKAYVHGETPRDLLDNEGINHWFERFRFRYAQVMKEATEGWSGINPMKLTELLVMGERAQATIVAVRDTGMTVNDDPRVELTLRFVPEGETTPVERKLKMLVSRIAVPQRGTTVEIAYDPNDPERLSFRHASVGAPAPAAPASAPAAVPVAVPGAAAPTAAGPSVVAPFPSLAKSTVVDADGETDTVGRLSKLAELHAAGALTADEFAAAKARVLTGEA